MLHNINKKILIKSFLLTASVTLFLPVYHHTISAETKLQSKTIEKADEGSQRMIVTFKESTSDKEKQELEEIGEVQNEFENINAVSIEVPEKKINSLKSNPNVAHVEEDIILKVNYFNDKLYEQIITYPIAALNGQESWNSGLTGTGVRIAVIDSGVSRHSDLIIAGGQSFVDYTDSYYDDNAHGTHVAGIISAENNSIGIVGIAPDSRIYALKVLDSAGEGYLSDIIEAIDWSIENNMDIINMSLGTDIDSPLFKQAVDRAYSNGILVVAASGNDGVATVGYPAAYDSVIAVGATDPGRQLAEFSNTGPEIEVVAPGVDVISLYPDSSKPYEMMSGTSMATPYASGVLALWKQLYPNATVDELRTKLHQYVIDLGAPSRDSKFGYGLVQAPTSLNALPVPSNFIASNVTSYSTHLNWDESPGATTYRLYRNGTRIYEGSNTNYIDNSLTPHTYYKYELYASDGNRSSFYPANTGIISLPLKPQSPSNFISKNISSNSVTLSWNSSQYATYYQLKRNGIVIYKGNQLSFTDKNLQANTSYIYEVIAGNYAHTSEASNLSTTTSNIDIPTNLDLYVFPSKDIYYRGTSAFIGIYSRHSGNVVVPWARFDILVTSPNGSILYKNTHYTQQDGRFFVSIPTSYKNQTGNYQIKVLMSKSSFEPVTKYSNFYLK